MRFMLFQLAETATKYLVWGMGAVSGVHQQEQVLNSKKSRKKDLRFTEQSYPNPSVLRCAQSDGRKLGRSGVTAYVLRTKCHGVPMRSPLRTPKHFRVPTEFLLEEPEGRRSLGLFRVVYAFPFICLRLSRLCLGSFRVSVSTVPKHRKSLRTAVTEYPLECHGVPTD